LTVCSVRNPKESAVHRSLQTPPGYPLVTGLGLPSAQKYTTRGGDIRDIWKLAVEKGKGKLLTVRGSTVVEHDISTLQFPVARVSKLTKSTDTLTQRIHALGSHLTQLGAKRIAIYLPNDTENLVASFGKWLAVPIAG
jgi:hypothetical protein